MGMACGKETVRINEREQKMSTLTSREIQLKSRPEQLPSAENFELVEVPVPDLQAGEILVKNLFMSVDPYMRGRMRDVKSYADAWQLGEVMNGGAVGKVIASQSPDFSVGDYVCTGLGWREYSVSTIKGGYPQELRKIDPALGPLSAFIGTLGMPGMTAYTGLKKIGEPKVGETLFVSAASGAVGAIVCQIGKILGCRVVGSAGSDEKVAWLKEEAGVDEAINYKTADDLQTAVAKACPDGIDVYFENVGGEHLVTALNLMNKFGRIILCGMISMYNEPVPGPQNLGIAIGQHLRLQGFIVTTYWELYPQFLKDMGQWIGEGKIKWKETVVEGLENAPEAFIGLFRGENFGKMVVKLSDE